MNEHNTTKLILFRKLLVHVIFTFQRAKNSKSPIFSRIKSQFPEGPSRPLSSNSSLTPLPFHFCYLITKTWSLSSPQPPASLITPAQALTLHLHGATLLWYICSHKKWWLHRCKSRIINLAVFLVCQKQVLPKRSVKAKWLCTKHCWPGTSPPNRLIPKWRESLRENFTEHFQS